MHLWIIKRPNILAYLENISVALYVNVEEISAEFRDQLKDYQLLLVLQIVRAISISIWFVPTSVPVKLL